MYWKTNIVLTVILAGMVIFWKTYDPPLRVDQSAPLLEARQLDRMEIVFADHQLELLRNAGLTEVFWTIEKPRQLRADPLRIKNMMTGLRAYTIRTIREGDSDWDPKVFGLDKPMITVHGFIGDKKITVHFGNPEPLVGNQVYARREGEDAVHLLPKSAREAFDVTLKEVRDKKVHSFRREFVKKILGRKKYIKADSQGPRTAVHEFEMVRFTGPDKVGWFVLKPYEERLDDMKVAQLLSALTETTAEEFSPLTPALQQQFDEPVLTYDLYVGPENHHVQAVIGEPDKEDRKRGYPGRFEIDDEVAFLSKESFEKIPNDLNNFRSSIPFSFDVKQVKAIAVKTREGTDIRIIGTIVTENGRQRMDWKVEGAKGFTVKPDRIEDYVRKIYSLRIKEYISPQPNLKMFGLDDPELTITFHVQVGEEVEAREYQFGRVGSDKAYMKKAWHDEIHEVEASLTRVLAMGDVNLRSNEMLQVPRESIYEFAFDWRLPFPAGTHYRVRRDKAGIWAYINPDSARAELEVSATRIERILKELSYVESRHFVGTGPEEIQKYNLGSQKPHGRVEIRMELDGKKKEKVLFITDNLSRPPQEPAFLARFEDSPIVFQLNPIMVMELTQDVYRRTGSEPEDNHQDH